MKLIRATGDLFTSRDNLAHCVSRDFHMNAGIAVKFKSTFGNQEKLSSGGWSVGTTARLTTNDRHVFYLVTKERYFLKPSYDSLKASLVELARWVELLGIERLAIPRLGCGKDGLKWPIVRRILIEVFEGINVIITVFRLRRELKD
ncbi:ADP-ribose glycohydrolase OARD1-like [Thrips palmi]|uniref:ADP-ribose glycohydrolase OARD1-like n=1 Tax=Thrips palmi TaxID=161013 RepID=A0A6P8ZZM2_THRPL|nr:ADP-ribose glycohydrolase OARD1-like [Thrips palmi]